VPQIISYSENTKQDIIKCSSIFLKIIQVVYLVPLEKRIGKYFLEQLTKGKGYHFYLLEMRVFIKFYMVFEVSFVWL